MAHLLPMSSRVLRPWGKGWNTLSWLDFLPSLPWRRFSYSQRNKKGDVLLMDEVVVHNLTMVVPLDEIKRLHSSGVDMTSPKKLPPRTPDNSHARAVIPLGTDAKTRENYISASGAIRLGKVLEDLDNIAGFCSFKHIRDPDMPASQKSAALLVTVMIDHIDIDVAMPPLSPYKDIYFDGKITWAGQSSMECTLYIEQEYEGKIQQYMKATVVFVSRDPVTLRAASISPLDLVTDEDKKAFQQGKENKEKRIQEAAKSVLKIAPSREESLMIHDIFLSSLDEESETLSTKEKPQDSLWMEDTIVKSCIICHPTQRNVFNKVFGGFLIRKAFEMAHITAVVHSKCSHPRCKNIDDMLFRRPVEIGSTLFLSSQIVYNNGSDLQVRVRVRQLRMGEYESHDITNDCHFTFDCSDGVDGGFVMPRVLPKTYAEAMLYIDGKRRYDQTRCYSA